MVMSPMSMMTPEQQRLLTEVQKYTKDIHALIKRDGNNSLTVILNTTNPLAEPYLSQIRNSLISSLATTLYTFFNIQGHVEG